MAETRERVRAVGRGLLIGAPIVLGVFAIVVIGQSQRSTGSGPVGSTFATTDRGAKASYLLLERLGHRVQRRTVPLGALGAHRLVFVLSPETEIDDVDGTALTEWLRQGGTVVLGVNVFTPPPPPLLEALQIAGLLVHPTSATTVHLTKEWAPARTLSVHARVVRPAVVPSEDDDGNDDDVAPLASDDGTAVAHTASVGFGRVYIVDARVFSNTGLKAADNALFLAALAARHAGRAPIVFDEFSHGFGDAPAILGAVAGPLKLAAAVGGLALLIYALAIGRRLGPPSPEPQIPRHAAVEQIETLAGFFAENRDRQIALLALAAYFDKPALTAVPRTDRALVAAARELVARPAKGTEWPSTASRTPPPK